MSEAGYRLQDEHFCERCIWSHDFVGLAQAAPCDPTTWAGSIKSERDRLGPSPDLRTRPVPHPPYMRCAAVTMVRNEADIIHTNLAWLHAVGVRRFAVMDNGSEDATWAEIQRFAAARPDVELLAVSDPIVRHIQAEKITGLCHLVRSVWPDVDWLMPFDADEFLVPRFGLRALAHVPESVDSLTVPKVVHFRPHGSTGKSAPLKGMTLRCQPFMLPAKIILRARADLDVRQGNHSVSARRSTGPVYAGGLQFGLHHREFQTRSFAQFLSKVRQGGRDVLAARQAGLEVGGQHWMVWYETLQAGGETALRAAYKEAAFRNPDLHHVDDPFTFRG